MILFPAIDLKDGACVRLLRGDMDKATVFNDDPGAQAGRFVAAGAEWLHIVDLNGAFAGAPVNGAAVAAILAATPGVPAQLGGGIRDLATIERWLDAGIARVILGTVAVKQPSASTRAAGALPSKAGPRNPISPPPIWRAASRMPASPRSSTPISTETARCRASMPRRPRRWRVTSACR